MSTARPITPTIVLHEGRPVTTSREIARMFERRHDHVLRDIDNVCHELRSIGQDPLLKFEAGVYALPSTGRQQHRQYLVSKNGLVLLVMGWTGPKAFRVKTVYIDEFDRMEALLRSLQQPSATQAKAAPPWADEPWFRVLQAQLQVMQGVALARALGVSHPQLSQIINGSGEYGTGRASTERFAARVRKVFRLADDGRVRRLERRVASAERRIRKLDRELGKTTTETVSNSILLLSALAAEQEAAEATR